jgi:hypothetical protein
MHEFCFDVHPSTTITMYKFNEKSKELGIKIWFIFIFVLVKSSHNLSKEMFKFLEVPVMSPKIGND